MSPTKDVKRLELSRSITEIESFGPESIKLLRDSFSKDSFKKTVCFTGPGGVGKSSLIAQLAQIVAQTKKLAWLACDPSSPVSGGSLLGDRIRMKESKIEEKLFVRSLSTRGSQAYSLSIPHLEVYLENFFDEVWVETAGSGQTQFELARLSALTVLVLQPETGDEVQWMKSGLRESVDLFVINKSDLQGAESMKQNLIELGAPKEYILQCSALKSEGLEEIINSIESLRQNLDWEQKGENLREALARNLYLKKAMKDFEESFASERQRWMQNPYDQLSD